MAARYPATSRSPAPAKSWHSVDVRKYKLASPLTVPWARGIEFCPLTPSQLASAALRSAGGSPFRQLAEHLAVGCLPRLPASEYLGLSPPAIHGLARALAQAQRWARAPEALRQWLRRSVNDFPPVIEDGARAWLAEEITAYYGRPVDALTEAQVSWYVLLRGAFREFHIGESGKSPASMTQSVLRLDREERHRWQICA